MIHEVTQRHTKVKLFLREKSHPKGCRFVDDLNFSLA